MSAVVGDTITARLQEIAQELQPLEAQAGALKSEARALEKSLALITGTTNGSRSNGGSTGTAVTNEQILEFVRAAGKAVTSAEIAQGLNTTPRHLGRKLRKLADEGTLAGSKDVGFTAA